MSHKQASARPDAAEAKISGVINEGIYREDTDVHASIFFILHIFFSVCVVVR